MDVGDSLTWWAPSLSGGHQRIFVSHPANGTETRKFDNDKFEIRQHYNLYIKDAQLTDAGSYICEVSGQRNYSADLTVIGGLLLRLINKKYNVWPINKINIEQLWLINKI